MPNKLLYTIEYKDIIQCLSKAIICVNVFHCCMLAHEGNTHSHSGRSDRYCRHCNDVALAYDPNSERPRCRSCGKLG